MNASDKLKGYEVNLIIDWFFYTMSQEKRQDLMAEFPLIYRKLTGFELDVVASRDYNRKFVSTGQQHGE